MRSKQYLKNLSSETFTRFSSFPESKFIASEIALLKISKLIYKYRILNVIEFGTGIGTVYYLISQLPKKVKYFGLEENKTCLNFLNKNFGNVKIIRDIPKIKLKNLLVVIDGALKIEDVKKIISKKPKIVFVEGARRNTRGLLVNEFICSGVKFKFRVKFGKYSYFVLDERGWSYLSLCVHYLDLSFSRFLAILKRSKQFIYSRFKSIIN